MFLHTKVPSKKVTNGFLILLYWLQVIAENLSEEEIAGLKEMFKMIDTDNSGQISFEELKDGLIRFGATLNESEIYDLMQAVSIFISVILLNSMMLPLHLFGLTKCKILDNSIIQLVRHRDCDYQCSYFLKFLCLTIVFQVSFFSIRDTIYK